jgi:uncharacterized protein (TIGR03083 family)
MDDLLRRQWQDLRTWLEDVDVLGRADVPTGLGDWTVGDLVAHLGLGLRLVTGIRPAPDGTEPMTLREYVAAYPPAALAIAGQTEEVRTELRGDVLAGLDRIAAEAFEWLAAIDSHVVLARRGPITREDYALTRLLELVVHGDDLARALDTPRHPGDRLAVKTVATALALAYGEVTGGPPPAADQPLAWIRLAAGRVPSEDRVLPLF